jgi:hypothetical protein
MGCRLVQYLGQSRRLPSWKLRRGVIDAYLSICKLAINRVLRYNTCGHAVSYMLYPRHHHHSESSISQIDILRKANLIVVLFMGTNPLAHVPARICFDALLSDEEYDGAEQPPRGSSGLASARRYLAHQ